MFSAITQAVSTCTSQQAVLGMGAQSFVLLETPH
jgi:hypothetical protein